MIKQILIIAKYIFIISFTLVMTNVNAQKDLLNKYEDSLKNINKTIINSEQDYLKKQANERFLKLFEKAINLPNSFNYPFDSLVSISKIISPDKRFRIFSWASIDAEGKYNYYGIIQMQSGNKTIYLLTDKSDSIQNPDKKILTSNNWFGAVYYKIIYTEYKKDKYYTLLGWRGNYMSTRKKIIDVITFNSDNIPLFGAPIFKTDKAEPDRIIFEYSADAVMSLKYEQQYYNKIKGQSIYAYDRLNKIISKNEQKHIKKVKANMIIFDRLVSLTPSFDNQYQFYVPSTDYVDGFLFNSGKWRMIFDIDARNPQK